MSASNDGDAYGNAAEGARFYSHEEILQDLQSQAESQKAVIDRAVASQPGLGLLRKIGLTLTDKFYREKLRIYVEKWATDIERPLTEDEARRIAHVGAETVKCEVRRRNPPPPQSRSKQSTNNHEQIYDEAPALLGTTFFFWYRGRRGLRFPFSRGPTDPRVYPFLPLFLAGRPSIIAWQITRFLAYGIVSAAALGTIRTIMVPWTQVSTIRKDPVLTATAKEMFRKVAQREAEEKERLRMGRMGVPPKPRPYTTPTVPTTHEAQVPPPQQQQQQQQQEGVGTTAQDWDDVSPVEEEPRPAPPSSAWEKLRRQATTSSGGGKPAGAPRWRAGDEKQTNQEPDSSADSERDQAQKEFDAMLERERRNASDSS